MMIQSLLLALFVCALIALAETWFLHDFVGPDGEPPSG